MKKVIKNLLFLGLLIVISIPLTAQAKEQLSSSKASCELMMAEQKLWIDHVLWTRNFIISDLASLEDKEMVLDRLLQNQDDIGDSIKSYYGEEAGNQLSKILREHIVLAGQVVDAAKSGNKTDLEKYNKLWYQNADQIADFLSNANPNYSNKTLKDMLYTHLQLITEAVTARLNKDWQADIIAYDKGEDHMVKFAKILVEGIITQFPEQFK